jgi:hypothetical protein
MICIVPLAGPDFYDPAYGAKPFVKVGKTTLIEETLGKRSWLAAGALSTNEIVFVLRDSLVTADAEARLVALYPGARVVRLSHLTGGALFSALAGAALAPPGPVIVDLVDLAFDTDAQAVSALMADRDVAGFIPWFEDSDPAYSYLRFEGDRVVETAEKKVISNRASAGAYFFHSAPLFLQAASATIEENARVNGALFLCPAYNALIRGGKVIRGLEVSNVRAYSKDFHRANSARYLGANGEAGKC